MDVGKLVELNAAYARAIDNERYEEWPKLFHDPCLYKVTTAENVAQGLEAGLIWADSRGMLEDRISALRQANIYERQRYRHVVGLPHVTGQADGAADRGVGAVAGPEQIDVGIHADLVGQRTADDQQRRRSPGTGGRAMEVEVGTVHRLEGGNHDGKVLGQASGHHGVHRRCVQRQVEAGRRMPGDHGLWRPAVRGQHRLHPVDRRRHHRQAVGPALLETEIDGAEQVVGRLVDAGRERGHKGRLGRAVKLRKRNPAPDRSGAGSFSVLLNCQLTERPRTGRPRPCRRRCTS